MMPCAGCHWLHAHGMHAPATAERDTQTIVLYHARPGGMPGPPLQSSTRYVSAARRKRLIMAPVYDMANHERDCPHTINPYEDSTYLHIIAGKDVKAGEEVREGQHECKQAWGLIRGLLCCYMWTPDLPGALLYTKNFPFLHTPKCLTSLQRQLQWKCIPSNASLPNAPVMQG